MKKPHNNGYGILETFPNNCIIYDSVDNSTSDCYAYKRSVIKTFMYVIACIFTCGFLMLISYWKPHWKLFMTHSLCSLWKAKKVLIVDQYGCHFVETLVMQEPIKDENINPDERFIKFVETKRFIDGFKFFYHKKIKYTLSEKFDTFYPTESIEGQFDCSLVYSFSCGLKEQYRSLLLNWYGQNSVDIEIKSYFLLFLEECADAFYVFQILSCILWFSDDYYYYASAIVIISVTSISISIYQTRQYLITLRNMIAKSDAVTIFNSLNEEVQISSDDLVPGDILVLPKNGGQLFCDAVLLSGTTIVNESMLTGESVPVTKTPFPHITEENRTSLFISSKYKNHILFCGTNILQTRYYEDEKVLALVIKTGFTTLKGGLIRSILFPKPVDFKFANDALKFVGVLGILACIGLSYSIYASYITGVVLKELIMKSLDVITIAVPPALPAAMTVGIVYALKRLKKKNIFCISPSHINISGKIKLFCFDKTGTLTEDGLHFCGVVPTEKMEINDFDNSLDEHPENDNIKIAMATCHSLTIIENQICGDPLDMQMFEATGWELEEGGSSETSRYGQIISTIVKPPSNSIDALKIKFLQEDELPLEVAILKQFTFSSELQRMSVVVRKLGCSFMEVYVKGSPEVISTLCDTKTIPKYFEDCLQSYSQQGYRILALAYKSLPKKLKYHKLQHVNRNEVESDLIFLGFLVMKNLVKKETAPTIKKLYNAKIRTVMVTGDNILTAVSVARECQMIKGTEKIITINLDQNKDLNFSLLGELDEHCHLANPRKSFSDQFEVSSNFLNRNYHFAITGKVFQEILNSHPQLFSRLLVEGTIFARMLPDQKEILVEQLQKLGYGVGMCGDGANDCGALKRAHAGVSLSETEASIASPFTSKEPDISCVVEVIREGRCALVTAFNIFKYMALYSMIQFASALMLYSVGSNLGDTQYLYIDLFLITSFAVTIGYAAPSSKFVAERPLGRLVHPIILFSVLGQITVQIIFQVLCYIYVRSSSYYQPPSHFTSGDADKIVCYENTALFTYTNYQYIIVAIIFSVGKPFRQSFYKNKYFFIALIFFIAINTLFVLVPWKGLHSVMQIIHITKFNYLLSFFLLVACNFFMSLIVDHVLLRMKCLQRGLKKLLCKKGPRNKYKHIMADIQADSSWPPMDKFNPRDSAIFISV